MLVSQNACQQTGKTLIRLLLQKQFDWGLHCLSRSFWQATCVQNFGTFTVSRITPHSNFGYFAPPTEQFFHGCQIIHWDPLSAKQSCPKKILVWAM